MCSGEENFQNDIENTNELINRVKKEYEELKNLEAKIKDNKFSLNDLAPIQNGYMGIGMNYFVGVKDSTL